MQSLPPSGLQPKINNIYEVIKMTKTMDKTFYRYNLSTAYQLNHVYNTFSVAKLNAWWRCFDMMRVDKGSGLKVITFNSQIFTAGYEYTDTLTGRRMFCYITPTKVKRVDVEGWTASKYLKAEG